MKKPAFFSLVIVLVATATNPAGSGEILGEKQPPATPQIFEPALFSMKEGRFGINLHSSLYFNPRGDEVFFTHQSIPPMPGRSTTIMVIRRIGDFWTEPVEAPFASDFSDQTGWFSPDGTRFYFGSVRPVSGGRIPEPKLLLWYTDREDDTWSEPDHVASFCELTADHGPLYIFDDAAGGCGKNDIYMLKFEKGRYSNPKNLGPPVNSAAQEYPVLVGPGEDYLIVYRTDRFNRAITGLYVTYKTDDRWTAPKKMGDEVGAGFDASLSPDGRILFVLKRRDGIYCVDAGIIDYLRTNDLNLRDFLFAVVDKGPKAVKKEFLRLQAKHVKYYNFDASVLNAVGDKLAAAGRFEDASGVWQVNFDLFPNQRSALRSLAVKAIEDSPEVLDLACMSIKNGSSRGTDVDEVGINRLGYLLLSAGRLKPAIRIFRLNISLFPRSFNVYDSFAEAMMKTGDNESALVNYRKSLEINPDNTNASDMLKKLLDE